MFSDRGVDYEKSVQLDIHLFHKLHEQTPAADNINERNLIWQPE